MKSSSDKSFSDFLAAIPRSVKLVAALAMALIIILSLSSEEESSVAEPTAEERIAELCSMIEGAGECRAVVTYEEKKSYFSSDGEGTILAVAVICVGNVDVKVEARIKRLISSMYGIGTNRIEVLPARSLR